MNAAGIARSLGAVRQSHNWRAPCPLGCGYSLSICDGANGRLLVFCHGGCGYDAVQAALVEYGLLDPDDGDLEASPNGRGVPGRSNDDRRRKIDQACAIYAGGTRDKRINDYLWSRLLKSGSDVLRFLAQAPHRLGARLPAMLAPIVDVGGEQIGLHLTYLRVHKDGAVTKADLQKEYQRECRGVIRGGAIRLMPHDPGVELVVAEGIESALSASEIFDLPAWAAGSAGALAAVELPPEVRRVLIAADNDSSGAGQRNALAAYDRWIAEGRDVCIKAPPDVGTDFNDLLMRREDVRH
jgi:hypothetical protein